MRDVIKEIIEKTKTKTKNILWRIVIEEKEIFGKKKQIIIAKQFNDFFINIGP